MKINKLFLLLLLPFLAFVISSCSEAGSGSGFASITPGVSVEQVSFDNSASEQIVTINLGKYNYYGAEVDDDGDGWCFVYILRKQGKIKITTTPNTGSIPRECHVFIWVSNTDDPDDEDGEWFTIQVQQLNTGGGGGGGGGGTTEKWVDLGLPSGTLWAAYNIGGSQPEHYGDYFAWAETQTKVSFTSATYKYAKWGESIYVNYENYYLTKYCTREEYGFEGFTDNLTELLTGDDAATVNWGDGARTPSQDDWNELKNNTTHDEYVLNGINGRRYVGSNGKSIFIPFAGYIDNETLHYDGFNGIYWSRNLKTTAPTMVHLFNSTNSGCSANAENSRFFGCPVRAVRSGK